MIVPRIAAPTTALFVTLSLFAGAGPAFAARGETSEERERREAEKKAEEEQVEPCPEDLWTIALPVEGLACVLLLPKDEKDQDAQKAAEEKKKDKRS